MGQEIVVTSSSDVGGGKLSMSLVDLKKNNNGIEKMSSSSWLSILSPSSLILFAWNTFNRFTFISVLFILICWTSAFTYTTLYFLYVPTLIHHRMVNFQFDLRCQDNCLNPSAEVPLYDYKTPSIFARGQSYDFHIELDLPESDVNWDQGMFMVRMRLLDERKNEVINYATPSILQYKSPILRIANLVCYWPLYLSGFTKEAQHLAVPLATNFIDGFSPRHGLASMANISIEAKQIQLYSATLAIKANLRGLRYYMVYWPLTSALFGTLSIGFFVAIIVILSVFRILRNNSASTTVENNHFD
ncbi:lipid droplet biogenesis associated protein seipin [Brevipalpus obovatus]|uniref:lipid droplet biogenesis associated protein seipin n=1 Tax=Brevipalpus obovatus TaxID=246614 RepID=UPI003D9EC676